MSCRQQDIVSSNTTSSLLGSCREFNNYQDKFFYEQFIYSGGIIIDNWITSNE